MVSRLKSSQTQDSVSQWEWVSHWVSRVNSTQLSTSRCWWKRQIGVHSFWLSQPVSMSLTVCPCTRVTNWLTHSVNLIPTESIFILWHPSKSLVTNQPKLNYSHLHDDDLEVVAMVTVSDLSGSEKCLAFILWNMIFMVRTTLSWLRLGNILQQFDCLSVDSLGYALNPTGSTGEPESVASLMWHSLPHNVFLRMAICAQPCQQHYGRQPSRYALLFHAGEFKSMNRHCLRTC